MSHTKNVIFPSSKKYVSCRRYESSVDELVSSGGLVDLAPNSMGCVLAAPRVIVCRSETMEWMEVIETGLALDSGAGENWGWLPFKETIRRAIDRGVWDDDHYQFSPLYVHPQEMTLCMICGGSRHCRDLNVMSS